MTHVQKFATHRILWTLLPLVARDVELQNTHIVLLKSPRDVHQVATLSVQLRLRSALVDWYRDATTVPFGHLLIDLSPRTDDRLRYCTNSANIPSKFHVLDNLKHLKYLDDEHTKSLYSPSIPVLSLACKIQFLKTCSKEFIRFLSECIVNLLQGNLPEVKRRHVLKYRDKIHQLTVKRTTWKQRRSLLPSQKGLLLIKTISPFVINHLSWDGTVCSGTSFCLQQQQQLNQCHKTRTTQIQTWANSHVPQRYVKKGINQQLSTSASLLVNKILESPRTKLSNSNTLILDGIETGVLLKDFAQRLRRKNVAIPVIYYTLLDAVSITPNLVVNSHAKGKERGVWIPFKIWTTKVAETLHARICGIWFCAQSGKSIKTLSVKGQNIFTFKDIIY